MAFPPLAVHRTGLVSSVGLSAEASCAALRAKLTNPHETRFADNAGNWIVGHEVPLGAPWRGLTRLAHLAARAIGDCLRDTPRATWPRLPVLLCVAEPERPGRPPDLDTHLLEAVQDLLGMKFAEASAVVAHGRVGAAIALAHASRLLADPACPEVLVVAADSLLTAPAMRHFNEADRLLTAYNSNGFMPGEAGAAVLLRAPGPQAELRCTGVGFGVERAAIDSGEPLRADGLTRAITDALAAAGCDMHDLDFRITDIAGEQYYFKEAALALSRTLRRRKADFDLWHPAESLGETGSAAGIATLVVADAACRKRYAPGPNVIAQFTGDRGQRAAAVLRFGGAP